MLPPPQPKAMFPNQKLQTFPWLRYIPLVIVQNLSSHLNVFALKTFLGDISAKVLISNLNEKAYKLVTLFCRDNICLYLMGTIFIYLINHLLPVTSLISDHIWGIIFPVTSFMVLIILIVVLYTKFCHLNPKERQWQRMLKLPHNFTHITR